MVGAKTVHSKESDTSVGTPLINKLRDQCQDERQQLWKRQQTDNGRKVLNGSRDDSLGGGESRDCLLSSKNTAKAIKKSRKGKRKLKVDQTVGGGEILA